MPAGCLDEPTALAFVRGDLPEDEVRRAEEHLDACEECLGLIVELTRGDAPDDATDAAPAPIRRGDPIGRYVVLELVGAGGMGVVYAAYDPQLDRRVALKLLRSSGAGSEPARERLLREARAMARVTHPNIVTVHDAGVALGRVFLAIEFVEGTTLRQWLSAERRSTKAIMERFLAAGRGLAAAHRAGLVHRDFKPDNVLLSRDGRVLVADFGLADIDAAPALDVGAPSAPATALHLTVTGSMLGTPAYMSPEQHRGEPADARTDVFSFCVALYEALHGEHPFRGDGVEEVIANVREGRVVSPSSSSSTVPAHVRRALHRGMRPAREDRPSSMDELLADISRDPMKRVRRLLLGGCLAVACVAIALGARRAAKPPETMCRGFEQKLAGIWDAESKRRVHDAFSATAVPFAADAWHGTERALDAWTHEWLAMHVDACEATHVRGEQSAALLDRRVACLGERGRELRALVDVLAAGDQEVVKNAVAAAQSLAHVSDCSATASLDRARLRSKPVDASLEPRIATVKDELARAKALRDAGKYASARDLATAAAKGADGVGDDPLRALALFRRGELEGLTGDLRTAERTLFESSRTADAALDDRTHARALAELLYVGSMNEPERMPFFRDESATAIARLGGDPEIEAFRASNLVVVLRSRGELDQAEVEAERAIALATKLDGAESRLVGIGVHNLAGVLLSRGEYARALVSFERALAITEQTLGSSHPNYARTTSEVCQTFYLQREYERAREHCERAVALGERVLAPDEPSLSDLYDNYGAVLVALGEYERAASFGERALAIREKRFGARHRKLLYPLIVIGNADIGLDRKAAAVSVLERALDVGGAAAPADDRAEASFALARALLLPPREPGAVERARSLAEAATAGYAPLGPAHAAERAAVAAWLDANFAGAARRQ